MVASPWNAKSIIILVTLVIQYFVSGDSQEYWYKNQIVTNILPSYTQAHDTLQTKILNELLAVNVTSLDEIAVGPLVNPLSCAVRKAHASLEQSVLASENFQVAVNTRLASNLVQAGVYEQNITSLNGRKVFRPIGEINELSGYSYGVTDQGLAETSIELNKTQAAKNALKEIPTGVKAMAQEALGIAIDTLKAFTTAKRCARGVVKTCLADPIGTTAKNANKAAMDNANDRAISFFGYDEN